MLFNNHFFGKIITALTKSLFINKRDDETYREITDQLVITRDGKYVINRDGKYLVARI